MSILMEKTSPNALNPTIDIDTQSQVYSDFRAHTNTTGCNQVPIVVPEKDGKICGY